MSNTAEHSVIIDEKQMRGNWELRYKIVNNQKLEGFGGRLLTPYIHPITKKRAILRNMDDQELIGFMIERPTMILEPDKDAMHRRIIDWLLGHPDVGVEGVSIDAKIKKNSNPKIMLVNLSLQEMEELDQQNVIDQVVGTLSIVGGPKEISLQKVRFLLAYFNVSYRDMRSIGKPAVEKKLLINRAKNVARERNKDGVFNAYEMKDVLNTIDNYEIYYQVKEMIRLQIVKSSNGMYKFNNYPIGSNFESVIDFMKGNPDTYIQAQETLTKELKRENSYK